MNALFREIPKVDVLMDRLPEPIHLAIDRSYIKKSIESTLNGIRDDIKNGSLTSLDDSYVQTRVLKELDALVLKTLKRVVNGTGIVLHTNLGRAVISKEIISDVASVFTHYNTLEYDVETGRRGLRYDHIRAKICMLTGAEDALVVNNNAAAVMLVLNSFAQGKEVIVSRGELVEIGGSFRVPDVMRASGCTLIEVGTTNKTHLRDYEKAITDSTGLIMKVHTSNYKVVGFSESVDLVKLKEVAGKSDIVLYEDIGSGLLYNFFDKIEHEEPVVPESIAKGLDLASFSGDKLFGGAQAGIIVGKKQYIQAISKNPLLRAFRIDKFSLSIIDRTLSEYLKPISQRKSIPTLDKLTEEKCQVLDRAQSFLETYKSKLKSFGVAYKLIETQTDVGGGSMPLIKIPSYALCFSGLTSPNSIQKKLRHCETPIVSIIDNDNLILDFKTIDYEDFDLLISGLEESIQGEKL